MVSLQPVTAQNWRALIKLELEETQKEFVASNLYSIAEAQFGYEEEGSWKLLPFGVYVGETPVGFVMYGLNYGHSRFQAFIARLMTDKHFQGKGYGRAAMQQVLDVLRQDAAIKVVGISYEPHNEIARKLYASFGFVEPGEIYDGEVLALLKL
ncbi:MAG: GNAT family N-acetyltransferase [Anaerolineales bacterium]